MASMRHSASLFAIIAILASTGVRSVPAAEDSEVSRQTRTALEAFKKADSTIAPRISEAAGYVIFPSVAKGGLGVGAAHGSGEVIEKGTWIGHAKLTQVTVGLQIGGQSFSELILFETPAALEHFKESNLEMSAQVSAVAAAEGAAKNANYVDGVMIFTRSRKGLMAEASIGGQKFRFIPLGKKD